jgi:hypothetical protein
MKTEIFDFTDFFERVTENPQYQNACSLIHQHGHMVFNFEEYPCRVYNPRLAVFLMQTHITGNRLLIVDEFTLIDGKTHQEQTRTQDKSIPIPIWPLLEAYCTGYQAGRAEMEKKYPNPSLASKDLKIIFDKELRRVPYNGTTKTTAANMAKIGHQAGQYSIVLDWAERYPETLKNVTTRPESEHGKRLSHPQIALLYAYRGEEITSNNCKDIAQEHGYINRTSGESIRQEFCKWQVPQNRIGNPDTVTSRPLKTKINNIEVIIPLLNKTQRGRAISEVNSLKKLLFDLFDEIL